VHHQGKAPARTVFVQFPAAGQEGNGLPLDRRWRDFGLGRFREDGEIRADVGAEIGAGMSRS